MHVHAQVVELRWKIPAIPRGWQCQPAVAARLSCVLVEADREVQRLDCKTGPKGGPKASQSEKQTSALPLHVHPIASPTVPCSCSWEPMTG